MKLKFIVLISCVFLITVNANASKTWGKTGHRVVAAIADSYLSGSAKRHIKKLLHRESLAFVSTFGDEIKSDKRYEEFYTWHFVNMPFDKTYEKSEKNPDGDLVTGIAYCKKIIQDKNASDVDKAFYLKMLIHLVGDLHQPMHVGLESDRGGNDIKLQWQFRDSNLHKVWDSQMIDGFSMSYSELANNAEYITRKQVKAIQKGTIIDWVNETQQLTKKVYASAKAGDNLRYDYSYHYLDIARKQMQIGGIRLAKVLNDLF